MSTPGHLNPSQKLHLLTGCQYADKLLSEIEATLAASQSKSPFPKFKPALAAAAPESAARQSAPGTAA